MLITIKMIYPTEHKSLMRKYNNAPCVQHNIISILTIFNEMTPQFYIILKKNALLFFTTCDYKLLIVKVTSLLF